MVPDLAAPHKKINNCPGTRQYQENPRAKGWCWSTPCLTGGKGSGYKWSATAPPTPDQCSSMQRGFPWTSGSSSKKKKKKEKQSGNQLLLHCGSPHRRSYTMGTAQESVRFNHWECDWDEKWGGAHNKQHMIPGRAVPTCSAQVAVPTRGYTHLQNQISGALWAGNWLGCRFLSALETRVSMFRQEAKSLPHPLGRLTSSRIWPEGLARALAAVYLRNAWAETGR